MKSNLSQIYPKPFLSLSKKIVLVKIYLQIFFLVCTDLHTSKFDAIAAITTFAPGCKLSANLFFRPVPDITAAMLVCQSNQKLINITGGHICEKASNCTQQKVEFLFQEKKNSFQEIFS